MRRVRLPFAFLGWIVIFITSIAAQNASVSQIPARSLSYCELVSNPEKFDGVRVKVRAVFNYGFEWSELLCMECRSRGRTRFEFSSEMSERELRKVEKTIKGHGAVVGDFTGMFHNAPAVYSDGAYKFQFELQKANKLKVLIKEKDWKTLITNVGWCEASHPSK